MTATVFSHSQKTDAHNSVGDHRVEPQQQLGHLALAGILLVQLVRVRLQSLKHLWCQELLPRLEHVMQVGKVVTAPPVLLLAFKEGGAAWPPDVFERHLLATGDGLRAELLSPRKYLTEARKDGLEPYIETLPRTGSEWRQPVFG